MMLSLLILKCILLLITRLIQLADEESPYQPEDKYKRCQDRDNDYDDPDQEFNEPLICIPNCP
jgi:hypothetical protein